MTKWRSAQRNSLGEAGGWMTKGDAGVGTSPPLDTPAFGFFLTAILSFSNAPRFKRLVLSFLWHFM